jgi:hypothetical protein
VPLFLRARNKNILVARPRERSRGKDAGSKGAETCSLWHVEHILSRRRSRSSLQLAAAEEIFVTRSKRVSAAAPEMPFFKCMDALANSAAQRAS